MPHVETDEGKEALQFTLQNEAFLDQDGSIGNEELQEMHGYINAYAGRKVILDLGAAPVITHELIAQLLRINDKLRSAGKKLVIRCNEGPARQKFKTTHTDEILQIEDPRLELLL